MNIFRQLIIITFVALQILPAQFLSIQGVARDNSGISLANGGYNFEFKLYVETTNGTAVWTEQQVLSVVNGVFSATLGAIESMAGLDYNTEYWLGLSIDGNAELSPRGKLTLSPYAVMAQVDGTSNVFPQDGNVGIGTTTPGAKLDVNGDITLTGGYDNPRSLRLNGGNSYGYLYGNFNTLGDGIHMGYNYYVDSGGQHNIIHPGGGTSRISMKYGELDFATAGVDAGNPTSKMFINSAGNIGIGTTSPQAKLDVSGDIALTGGYRNLKLDGGNSFGYLYSNYDQLGDGIHMGYNYYVDSGGQHKIIHPDGGTSRISMKYGELDFATGHIGVTPSSKMSINSYGEFKLEGQKPIILEKFNCGVGVTNINTGKSVEGYVAAIAGFNAIGGDINEAGDVGSIIRVEAMNDGDGNWHIVADFRSHNSGESWYVSVLFIDRKMAELIGY